MTDVAPLKRSNLVNEFEFSMINTDPESSSG